MTREQQIRAAMKELDGSGRAEIEQALTLIAEERTSYERAEKTKSALNKIASAMHRAQQALERLPPPTREEIGNPPFEHYKAAAIQRKASEKRSRDHTKLIAAREAQCLLLKFGYPDNTTRLDRWYRLAAVLYGDRKANLSWQCRKLKKERKRARSSKLSFLTI
ncbi:hypothetical protein IVA87_08040 [Bradyrhizobium sp. 147]|uniref:hypothetical protein n=1 Tax=Bradyrhizobium sp. 147 TaxID=2782623 RepID=UPI001FF7E1DB|nr:hypothetical protein [Bradyrhizobium sp. 147]MCK1679410.1 hypothetical protein [Bradyrhizobium sp. 147]